MTGTGTLQADLPEIVPVVSQGGTWLNTI